MQPSYQISVSTLPFPRPSRRRVSLHSHVALHALLPPLDISDSKHNSNPGGLYARRGNSSVATQSSSLIEISYPLTYLPNPPSRYAWLVRLNIPTSRHPEYFRLRESAITRLRRHSSSVYSIPVEFFGKLFMRRIVYSPTFTRRSRTHGLTSRAMLTRSSEVS